jgi:hypothetical protein
MALFQVNAAVPTRNTSSMLRVTIAIADDIAAYNVGSTSWSSHVNAGRRTIMDIAFGHIYQSTVNVDNASSRSRRNFHTVQRRGGSRKQQQRLVIGSHGWLKLHCGVSIPNVCRTGNK